MIERADRRWQSDKNVSETAIRAFFLHSPPRTISSGSPLDKWPGLPTSGVWCQVPTEIKKSHDIKRGVRRSLTVALEIPCAPPGACADRGLSVPLARRYSSRPSVSRSAYPYALS